jgi:chaperonin GroEL
MNQEHNILLFNKEAKEKLQAGINKVANAVKVTLGPKGRNVIYTDLQSNHYITKDGVTVAKNVRLNDAVEILGANVIREASAKTNDAAGDGTSTAAVLAQYIINEGLKLDANTVSIKRGLDIALEVVLARIDELSENISNNKDIENIATISANNDFEIGSLIAGVFDKIGRDGVITVEEAKGADTYIDIVEGMQFDRGFFTANFITNPDTSTVEFENAFVLCYDGNIKSISEVTSLLDATHESGKPLVIICNDLNAQVTRILSMNKLNNGLKIAVVRSPGFADNRKNRLQDIATATGGVVLTEDYSNLSNVKSSELGFCDKIVIDKETTTITGGQADARAIETRIEDLRGQLSNTTSKYNASQLEERIAKLQNGVAVLYVGAATEVEMKEKRDRIDDALAATKAAIKEGIVTGGGVTYIECKKTLNERIKNSDDSDESKGVRLLYSALSYPLLQILDNAGISGKESADILNDIETGSSGYGYNARTDKYEDLKKAGVIDSTTVAKEALINAVSVGGMLLTTECVMTTGNEIG